MDSVQGEQVFPATGRPAASLAPGNGGGNEVGGERLRAGLMCAWGQLSCQPEEDLQSGKHTSGDKTAGDWQSRSPLRLDCAAKGRTETLRRTPNGWADDVSWGGPADDVSDKQRPPLDFRSTAACGRSLQRAGKDPQGTAIVVSLW